MRMSFIAAGDSITYGFCDPDGSGSMFSAGKESVDDRVVSRYVLSAPI